MLTFWPLVEIVRQVAGSNPPEGVSAALGAAADAPLVADRVAGAVGATDAAVAPPEETSWAFRRLFEALASERPLIVVDDIHWAEPTLLDLLEYVAGFSSGAPVILLCVARPDLFADQLARDAGDRAGNTLAIFLGRALYEEGLYAEAGDLIRALRPRWPSTDVSTMLADGLLDLAEVLVLSRKPEEARAAVEDAVRLYELKGNVVSAAAARRLLA